MLTADLVRAQRRGDRLLLPRQTTQLQQRMRCIASTYLVLARQSVGCTLKGLRDAFADAEIDFKASDKKLYEGLKKLILDRCQVAMEQGLDPIAVRRLVFALATLQRSQLQTQQKFCRDTVLRKAAQQLDVDVTTLDAALHADLKDAQIVQHFDDIQTEQLLENYQRAQAQAVLLRATHLELRLSGGSAGAPRRLFHALKFRRLLYRIERDDDAAFRIIIDGPMSLFSASTKYGLQLAMLVPVLEEAGPYHLSAELRWGKERKRLQFEMEGAHTASRLEDQLQPVNDEVAAVLSQLNALESDWQAELAKDLLDVPGVGVCVPDLVLNHRHDKRRVYVEIMGYWSREAVFRRIDLVKAGLTTPLVFAVSQKLRVSEALLDAKLPAELYVYKGRMRAKALLEHVDSVAKERA